MICLNLNKALLNNKTFRHIIMFQKDCNATFQIERAFIQVNSSSRSVTKKK